MLLLPPIHRRIPASHSRASLCSIGAEFMELVISRGTFNPENHELRVQFELARHIHPRKSDVLAAFLPSEATKGLHYFLQTIYRPFNTVVIQNILI
jgi:hypothetical protein